MKTLIITSGNNGNFKQVETFLSSLRSQGKYKGYIAICDNEISGEWDKPGTWLKEASFTHEQIGTIKSWDAQLFTLQDLISSNEISEEIIEKINSPTQRYPYKFVYNTLISKKYVGKVDSILYFDSDVYFQSDIKPILNSIEFGKIIIVKEFLKMKESFFLNKWLRFSDFSKLSNQDHYLSEMLPAENFCSGFFGSDSKTFHHFNLLALLIASNQFINFYSDQPLINILKTFFKYPFKEIGWSHCLHLGELSREKYQWVNQKLIYQDIVPISLHFNGGRYKELDAILSNTSLPISVKQTFHQKVKGKIRYFYNKISNK